MGVTAVGASLSKSNNVNKLCLIKEVGLETDARGCIYICSGGIQNNGDLLGRLMEIGS